MSKEFNYILRLHGTNLDGTKLLPYALCDINGVGIRIAHTIIKKLKLDPSMRLGHLPEADARRLEEVFNDSTLKENPVWMLNRRKDPQSGENLHLLTSDLTLKQREDIDLMREIRSWKGERHSQGLKVRGQRTKTTARKGRSVGVSRRRVSR